MFWYCLPDSHPSLHHISRDFVPGYSRFARYCLPDKSYCVVVWLSCCLVVLLLSCLVVCIAYTFNKATKQQNNQTTFATANLSKTRTKQIGLVARRAVPVSDLRVQSYSFFLSLQNYLCNLFCQRNYLINFAVWNAIPNAFANKK